MWLILRAFLTKLLQDGTSSLPSFGKTVAVPFLVTAWFTGTYYAVVLLRNWKENNDHITDLMWVLAGIAMALYVTYKTGSVAIQRKNGKMVVEKDGTSSNSTDAPTT